MRRIPSFFALRAFEAAARLRSFTAAGDELALTPSAISHQIRALERHFGRALFLRTNRQVAPTPDGERLLSGLTRAFDSIEAACSELSPSPGVRSLAVHCTPSFAGAWLGPRLPRFMELNPSIAIRLSSGAEPVDLARHEEIDVAIAYGVDPAKPGVVSEALGEEEIAAVCAPEVARRIEARPAALAETPLLESSYSPVRWRDWFSLNGLDFPVGRQGASFDRGSLVISAAAQGLGLALETLRFAETELASGRLVRLDPRRFLSIRRAMHFLCRRAGQRDETKVAAFRSWLLEEAGARAA